MDLDLDLDRVVRVGLSSITVGLDQIFSARRENTRALGISRGASARLHLPRVVLCERRRLVSLGVSMWFLNHVKIVVLVVL